MDGRGQPAEPNEQPPYDAQGHKPASRPPSDHAPNGDVIENAYSALLALRKANEGSSSSFEPVSVEMVEAILQQVFSSFRSAPALSRQVAEQVAVTLREDVKAGPRMQLLWDQLQSVSSEGNA